MTYQGVKFETEIIEKKVPKDPRIEELKKWGKLFHDEKFAPPIPGGAAGNLSFRTKEGEDRLIITGSGIDLGNLKDDCFVEVTSCDFKKGKVYARGVKNPSSEGMLHYAIFEKRKDVNAIFHGHCEEIMRNLDKLKVPETKKEEPYGTMELVNSVLEILGKENFVIMKNHGFIALGKSMEEAGELALRMNKTCLK